MDDNQTIASIVRPKMCPIDQTILLFDAGGVITELGEDCWYCPLCGYIDC